MWYLLYVYKHNLDNKYNIMDTLLYVMLIILE